MRVDMFCRLLGAGLVVALLGGGAAGAAAQPVIDVDTTWGAGESPVVLLEDATVLAGVTLTVEPGVTVELGAGVSLHVEGSLVARGSAAAPVIFAGVEVGGGARERWGSVVFWPGSAPATYARVHDYQGGSALERCRFEGGTRALVLRGASPWVSESVFQGNRCEGGDDTDGGAAMLVLAGSAPRVRGCTFSDNVASGAEGGAVLVRDSTPIFQDNSFVGNVSFYGGALAAYDLHAPLVGNTFEDNEASWEGGAVALVSCTSSLLGNVVRGNRSLFDGAGVHVCRTCFPHSNPILMDNRLLENEAALEGGGGIGAAYLRGFAHNDLAGNTSEGEPLDFGWYHPIGEGYPDWAQHPVLLDNWWGTTDPLEVAAHLFDGADESGYGVTQVMGIRAEPIGPPETRLTLSTRKIRYQAEGEPMPIFLTVVNPGPERAVRLLLLVQQGALPPVVWPGPVGLFEEAPDPSGEGVLATLPAGSVQHLTLAAPGYPATPGAPDGAVHGALYDAETGARIGEEATARMAFLAGELSP